MPNNNERNQKGDTSKRGFGSMDDDKQREIASQGGKQSGGNFKNDPQRAAEAGRLSWQSRSSRSSWGGIIGMAVSHCYSRSF